MIYPVTARIAAKAIYLGGRLLNYLSETPEQRALHRKEAALLREQEARNQEERKRRRAARQASLGWFIFKRVVWLSILVALGYLCLWVGSLLGVFVVLALVATIVIKAFKWRRPNTYV